MDLATVTQKSSTPLTERQNQAPPALPESESLSGDHLLSLTVRPELAILGRISLVFSRRGLRVREFNYFEAGLHGKLTGQVKIRFKGNPAQLDSVTRDLSRIVDIINVGTTTLHTDPHKRKHV